LMILKRSIMAHQIRFSIHDLYSLIFIITIGLTFKGIKKYTNLFNPMD
jgi:hypothetical protein